MKKFSDYAEKAIKRYGLAGYNNLAREIGVTKCVMSEFRNEKKTPSEETFLNIVELAGLPKEEALIDLKSLAFQGQTGSAKNLATPVKNDWLRAFNLNFK